MFLTKRVAVNDPLAFQQMGVRYYEEGDYDTAFGYFTKAAELDRCEKNEEKEKIHSEEAAIAGHPIARYNLAIIEGCIGREKREMSYLNRSVKHFIIAANLGCNDSIQQLKHYYSAGWVSTEDFAAALRANQAAVDATKSPQREVGLREVASSQDGYRRD
ncbi:hypothetical protein QTG54_003428 [Skeletonema marinoi]|uniref:Uncharacterized protein n=1 Tax=Skeletonema marinoi TaxID=267567 RepID=A0AAD8YH96_9STRA|nr:hypothetical protein QTG54_003428 [Skeletonema marinoi]